jgi:hypothetical protein
VADKKLFFTVGADVAPGSKEFAKLSRDVKKSMGEVDDSINESKTKAQQVAEGYSAAFEQIDAAIIETKATADTLAQKLGPELAGKIDTSAAVQEFRSLGLTLDEIKADADVLAAALKQADDISLKHGASEFDRLSDSTRRARGDIDGVRSSSDQTRSVMANLVGNSAQDMAQLGGVAGTAGVALGQLGEYAADGNIQVKNLAKLAGPMAALGVATMVVSEVMSGIKLEKTFRAGLVDDFRDDLKEATTIAEQLRDTLKETGDIEFAARGGGFLGLGKEMDSLLPLIDELGLSVKDVVADIMNPGAKDAIRARTAEMVFQGDAAESLAVKWNDYADGIDQYGDSWRLANEKQAIGVELARQFDAAVATERAALDGLAGDLGVVATNTDEVANASNRAATATDTSAMALGVLKGEQDQAAAAAQSVADALQEETDKLNGLISAAFSSADASIALEEAQEDVAAAIRTSIDAHNDGTSSAEDLDAAVDGERDAIIKAAGAARDQAAAFWEANGATISAKDEIDAFNGSLLNNARSATPAARDAIAKYIIEANGIPAEKATEITAAIRAGDIPRATSLINDASKTRNAAINVDDNGTASATGREIDNAARNRNTTIRVAYATSGFGIPGMAEGGTVKRNQGVTLVGEKGPELVTMPAGSVVHPASETRRMMSGGGGGGTTAIAGGGSPVFNLTINAGMGTNGADVGRQVVAALKEYSRNNGNRWLQTLAS